MKISVRKASAAMLVAAMLGLLPGLATGFDSGSTGADGAFNPTADTQLDLPPDGVFNYTTVNIPAGVTVTYSKNGLNTPVTILAAGDVTIAGTIDVSGTNGSSVDEGNLALVFGRVPGGPGGLSGGPGGLPVDVNPARRGGDGLGPGAGQGAEPDSTDGSPCGGAGGGYGSAGVDTSGPGGCMATGGSEYGDAGLLPLIGGSGGGGGTGADSSSNDIPGASGGGGGGAILIACSGTVNVTGAILARGGRGGNLSNSTSTTYAGAGGGGSGGAIRIVATTIAGDGAIEAVGGSGGSNYKGPAGAKGGDGRIRLEAEHLQTSTLSSPIASIALPQSVFVAGVPSLRITEVGGVPVPAIPTGVDDVKLPGSTANPVIVTFATTDVPLDNTVTLTVTPPDGPSASAQSDVLSGTVDSATATVAVDLPQGPSVLTATVSYTVVAALGDALSRFAMGERVERVLLADGPSGSQTTFVSVSGKEYTWPGRVAAMN